jgi:hypothetical protein
MVTNGDHNWCHSRWGATLDGSPLAKFFCHWRKCGEFQFDLNHLASALVLFNFFSFFNIWSRITKKYEIALMVHDYVRSMRRCQKGEGEWMTEAWKDKGKGKEGGELVSKTVKFVEG